MLFWFSSFADTNSKTHNVQHEVFKLIMV